MPGSQSQPSRQPPGPPSSPPGSPQPQLVPAVLARQRRQWRWRVRARVCVCVCVCVCARAHTRVGSCFAPLLVQGCQVAVQFLSLVRWLFTNGGPECVTVLHCSL